MGSGDTTPSVDITETVWRRGWNDAKRGWTRWYFVLADMIVVPSLAIFVSPGVAIGIAALSLFFVWVGATAAAPIRQRNEARLFIDANSGPDVASVRSQLATHIMLLQTHLPVLRQIDTQERIKEYLRHIQATFTQGTEFINDALPQYLTRLMNDPLNPPTQAAALAEGYNKVVAETWCRVKGRIAILEEIYAELGRVGGGG